MFVALPPWTQVLCSVAEYDELPVRHNEDKINASMAATARLPVDPRSVDDPHTKANLLLQVGGQGGGCETDVLHIVMRAKP